MKNKLHISLVILALSLFFVTCGSTHQVDKPMSKSVSEVAPAASGAPGASAQPVNPFYTGSGGKNISLAILAPKTTGLTKDQDYIPALVQGEFVSNFSGYSALSVMDRENLDNVYGELLSGYYDDSDEAGLDLGHLTSADYLMNGSITRTAAGYSLQMQITKTADKMTAASYSGTCTFTELDNLTGIRRVSLDLLQKMGIELTDRAKMELTGEAAANHVNAQTALARGITAQQGGTVVEALSYYYQAAAFDPSLLEAANRAGVVSSGISSGNIGANVRNDIERRKEWLKILEEAENYFKNHQPWEIVYNPALIQGEIDYERETVSLSFYLQVRPTDGWKIVQSLIDGLDKTGKRDEWGLTWWPLTSEVFSDARINRGGAYGSDSAKQTTIACGLLNEKGKLLASEAVNCISEATFKKEDFASHTGGPPKKGIIQWVGSEWGYVIHNYVISTAIGEQKVVFKNVNANDITENMTVKIISVNGIAAEILANNGYIKISTGAVRDERYLELHRQLRRRGGEYHGELGIKGDLTAKAKEGEVEG